MVEAYLGTAGVGGDERWVHKFVIFRGRVQILQTWTFF